MYYATSLSLSISLHDAFTHHSSHFSFLFFAKLIFIEICETLSTRLCADCREPGILYTFIVIFTSVSFRFLVVMKYACMHCTVLEGYVITKIFVIQGLRALKLRDDKAEKYLRFLSSFTPISCAFCLFTISMHNILRSF